MFNISNYYKNELKHVACQYLGIDEQYIVMEYSDSGHSGPGYYFWDEEYPEDGSILINFKDIVKFYMPFLFKKEKEIFFS